MADEEGTDTQFTDPSPISFACANIFTLREISPVEWQLVRSFFDMPQLLDR